MNWREKMKVFYMDTATLLWNGNTVTGGESVAKFLENLPSTQHTLESLDSQPVAAHATKGQNTILVSAGGMVKYHHEQLKSFTQNFILTAQGTSWKIVSDCFRYAD